MGLFLVVRVSYSIPWTVWKCKSDFDQMFLAYPRCHGNSLGIAALENIWSHIKHKLGNFFQLLINCLNPSTLNRTTLTLLRVKSYPQVYPQGLKM